MGDKILCWQNCLGPVHFNSWNIHCSIPTGSLAVYRERGFHDSFPHRIHSLMLIWPWQYKTMLSIEELGKVHVCTHDKVIPVTQNAYLSQNLQCDIHEIPTSHNCTLTLANLVLMLSRLSLISSLSPPTGASLLRNSSHWALRSLILSSCAAMSSSRSSCFLKQNSGNSYHTGERKEIPYSVKMFIGI